MKNKTINPLKKNPFAHQYGADSHNIHPSHVPDTGRQKVSFIQKHGKKIIGFMLVFAALFAVLAFLDSISEQDIIQPQVVKLLIIGSVVGWSLYLSMKMERFRGAFKYLAIWTVIITIVSGIYLVIEEFKFHQNEQASVIKDSDKGLMVHRSRDGHFWLNAVINDVPVKMLVDTGASNVVLSPADAERVGVNLQRLRFDGRANTANGSVQIAATRVQTLELGNRLFQNAPVLVNGTDMKGSLLGMSVLREFGSVTFEGDRLYLSD